MSTTRTPRVGPSSPGLRIGSELALGAALLFVVLAIVAADLAGAFLGHAHLLRFVAAARFLVRALHRLHDPAGAWPVSIKPISMALFWSTTGALVVAPSALVLGGIALVRLRPGNGGFASTREVRATASLHAARRQARTTRPSLTGSPGQQRELAPSEVGYPLGRSVAPRGRGPWRIALVASWEHSLQLVAPPGSGKTLRVLAPILRQHPGPALATSTKPDLYEVAVAARTRVGPVVALDPEGLCPGADPLRWSPVAGCEDARVAERRGSALVAATGDGGDVRGGGFFRRSAATVLAAYLHAAALDGGTMRDVLGWAARPGDPAPLRILSREGNGTIDWSARLHAHTSGAEETTSGVVRTVDLALACFSDPAVLEATSPRAGQEFDAEKFLGDKGTVFALGKDRGSLGGSGPLVTAFCDELLVTAERLAAAAPGRRLDPPLLACLDEAPSIAPLPSLPVLVADGRGRGIVVLLAMQSFSQADERWGSSGARTIRNAASILMVFGGLSVVSDLAELSGLCGTREREALSLTEDGSGRQRVDRHLREIPVLSSSEIRSLPSGTALLVWGRLLPILSYLPGTWEGKDAKAIAEEERRARAANDDARHATDTDKESDEPQPTKEKIDAER